MRKKRSGVAEGVHQGVDLGAQSALAAAECLIFIFFWRAGAVLMSPHDRGVDHGVLVVGVGSQGFENLLPNTTRRPAGVARMDLLPVAEPLRKIAPGNARPVPVKHSLDEQTIVLGCHPDVALTARQQVLDPIPLVVAQAVAAHRSAPNQLTRYESLRFLQGNPLIEDRP